MEAQFDLYALLGVSPEATLDRIQQAYREGARRFHPDANANPGATQEFQLIGYAYEILSDSERRAAYDADYGAEQPAFHVELTPSRTELPSIPGPQVVYLLVDLMRGDSTVEAKPPLNVCMVIDRSTSMRGVRMEQVKIATQRIINSLDTQDVFAVVTFSDRAEVLVPAHADPNRTQTISKVKGIMPGGGTEILQGLAYGLAEVHRNLSPNSVNHVLLLTDGRTYGDEADSLNLASKAADQGIGISALGIGEEWNDAFLDQLAAETGGVSAYAASPEAVHHILDTQIRRMGGAYAERMQVALILDPGVEIQSAFRCAPDPQPITVDTRHLRLGALPRMGTTSVLFQFLVPARQPGRHGIARLTLTGKVLGADRAEESQIFDFTLPFAEQAAAAPPPAKVVEALGKLTLYRMQEKARASAEEGDVAGATRILRSLAVRLEDGGESVLARAALAEAERLARSGQLSAEGHKQLKYGTRALIVPATSTVK